VCQAAQADVITAVLKAMGVKPKPVAEVKPNQPVAFDVEDIRTYPLFPGLALQLHQAVQLHFRTDANANRRRHWAALERWLVSVEGVDWLAAPGLVREGQRLLWALRASVAAEDHNVSYDMLVAEFELDGLASFADCLMTLRRKAPSKVNSKSKTATKNSDGQCPHCVAAGKPGRHPEARCWTKYPHLRPGNGSPTQSHQ
jgi:hypothetical protein